MGPDLQTEWCVLAQAGRVGLCNVFTSTLEHASLTSVRTIVVCVCLLVVDLLVSMCKFIQLYKITKQLGTDWPFSV